MPPRCHSSCPLATVLSTHFPPQAISSASDRQRLQRNIEILRANEAQQSIDFPVLATGPCIWPPTVAAVAFWAKEFAQVIMVQIPPPEPTNRMDWGSESTRPVQPPAPRPRPSDKACQPPVPSPGPSGTALQPPVLSPSLSGNPAFCAYCGYGPMPRSGNICSKCGMPLLEETFWVSGEKNRRV